MIKMVITDLDSSEASVLDSIPGLVLKSCVPEVSYTPAEDFNVFEGILFSKFLVRMSCGFCVLKCWGECCC